MDTKASLYNKIVDLYKATGQGLLKHPMMPMDNVNELIDDGLLKIVTTPYSYLPDDVKICLTGAYCVEEEGKESNAVVYMRIYLNQEKPLELGKFTMTLKDAIQNPEMMEKYSEWLNKNHEEISKIHTLEYLEDTSDVLSDSDCEYIKKKECYTDNLSVEDGLKSFIEGTNDKKEIIKIQHKLIPLYEGDSKYTKVLEEAKNDIEKIEKELKKRNRIENWLQRQPRDKMVQNLINEF